MSIPVKLLLNQATSYLQPIHTHSVEIDGYRSRYLEAGSGNRECLVLLHGLGGSKAQWRSMMGAFSGRYRVVAPDVPGFCLHSPIANCHHTLKRLMVWLDEFLAAIGITDFSLVAHSTACPLAAVFTGNREKVTALALISFPDVLAPSFSGQGKAYEDYKAQIDFKSMEDWDAFFSRAFYQPIKVPNTIKRYNFNKFKQHNDTFVAVVDDLTKHQSMVMPYLKKVHCSALVLNGDHDNFADESFHAMLEAHLPQAAHVTLQKCGHMAFIDRYADVVGQLRSFFQAQLYEQKRNG